MTFICRRWRQFSDLIFHFNRSKISCSSIRCKSRYACSFQCIIFVSVYFVPDTRAHEFRQLTVELSLWPFLMLSLVPYTDLLLLSYHPLVTSILNSPPRVKMPSDLALVNFPNIFTVYKLLFHLSYYRRYLPTGSFTLFFCFRCL